MAQTLTMTAFDLPLYEATMPPSEAEGALRTRNSPDFEVQRSVVTDRGEHSLYKVQCCLTACLHGTLDKTSRVPASLIIFDYTLFNNKPGSKFTSATTQFEFSEYVVTEAEKEAASTADAPPPTSTGDSNPNVVAYAPFTQPRRWNFSTADKTSRNTIEADVGADAPPAKTEMKASHESEMSYAQKYFDEGKAGRHYHEGTKRYHKVWWNMIHNSSQKEGVAPTFRVAILVKRTSMTAKFKATFNIVVKGDVSYELSKTVDKFLRRTVIDDPVNFDPAAEPVGKVQEIRRQGRVGSIGRRRKAGELVSRLGYAAAQGDHVEDLIDFLRMSKMSRHHGMLVVRFLDSTGSIVE